MNATLNAVVCFNINVSGTCGIETIAVFQHQHQKVGVWNKLACFDALLLFTVQRPHCYSGAFLLVMRFPGKLKPCFSCPVLWNLRCTILYIPPPHKASAINVAQCRLSIPWFFKCLLLCLDNVTLLSHERASNGSSSRNHFSDPMQRGRSGTSCSSCQRQRQWTQVKMEIVYSLGCSGTMQWEVGKSKQGM